MKPIANLDVIKKSSLTPKNTKLLYYKAQLIDAA